ncbi:MAG: IS1595 family transposase [Elusimicrobiota bacterium]
MARPGFPLSLPEFFRMFPDERACVQFVIDSRWPDGEPICPKCGLDTTYPRKDRPEGRKCAKCGYIFSVTAGTVMENTKLPLSIWLQAAFLMVTDKRGISAKQLQRALAIKRYETAWSMLQKLRAAMVNPDRSKLTGRVEVDESYIGGPEKGKRGRGAGGKNLVVGAVEVRERTSPKSGEVSEYAGRVRFRHIDNAIQPVLVDFALDTIEGGTEVVTDGSEAYPILTQFGYSHEVESTARGMEQDAVLRHYHRAVANLKTWIKGTFHGRIEGKHLQGYLNEFAFRFNRRHNLFAAFQTMLGIAGKVKGPTQEALYAVAPSRLVQGSRP